MAKKLTAKKEEFTLADLEYIQRGYLTNKDLRRINRNK